MSSSVIFGTRAVIEAVAAGKEIEKILVQKGLSNELYHQLRRALKGTEVPIQFVPSEKLNRITTGNHQGVVAYLTEISYFEVEDLLPEVFESGRPPFVLILDRVTDVRNFGAIARTAECAGVDFIVIPTRGAAQINGDAIKTSAGALHRIKVCRASNLKDVMDYLVASGVSIVAVHEKTERYVYDLDLSIPLALIMGSEDAGISGEYLKRSTYEAGIPMIGKTSSLNVSVAAGIALFEVVKQRVQRYRE